MDGVRGSLRRHTRRVSAPVVALVLLAVVPAWSVLATDPAAGAGKPGKPVAKSPKGAVATVKPTFIWSKAARATSYEVRVYAGGKLVLKRTGVKKSSWKSTKALPENTALTWKVRGKSRSGSGAWSRTVAFRVVVAPPPSSAKAITAFSFEGLAPPVVGSIDEGAHTIALTVPFGTDRSALVATFTITGASVKVGGVAQTSGVTANDFGSPVTYTVTAADGSTQGYVVTVVLAPSPAKAITAFSFEGLSPPVAGDIDEGAHTIDLTVPFGTDRSALVATFATTGASVKVGGVAQTSGVTANDFGSPVTYTVTAADGSTQGYVVTVDEGAPYVGMLYGGGVVAYVDYDDGWHGLIASTNDVSAGIQWWNGSYVETGATESGLWSGLANSDLIVTVQGATATDYAAGLARACDDGGYTDWFLPTTSALQRLYMNRAAIGGFTAARYWSSSEWNSVSATAIDFSDGTHYNTGKDNVNRVRAVREF